MEDFSSGYIGSSSLIVAKDGQTLFSLSVYCQALESSQAGALCRAFLICLCTCSSILSARLLWLKLPSSPLWRLLSLLQSPSKHLCSLLGNRTCFACMPIAAPLFDPSSLSDGNRGSFQVMNTLIKTQTLHAGHLEFLLCC